MIVLERSFYNSLYFPYFGLDTYRSIVEETIYFPTNFQNLVLLSFYVIYQFSCLWSLVKAIKLLTRNYNRSSLLVIDISCNHIMQIDR